MANFIPRLEWNDITVTGDTVLGSNTVTNIAVTTSVILGMVINHAAFPAGSTITGKTDTTITVSENATSSNAGAILPMYESLEFSYPCSKNDGESFEPKTTSSESVAGVRQVQTNAIIAERELEFRFISKIQYDKFLDRFYKAWALYGYSFKYFESQDEVAFFTYELDTYKLKPQREIPKGGDFLYKFKISMRRVV